MSSDRQLIKQVTSRSSWNDMRIKFGMTAGDALLSYFSPVMHDMKRAE